MVAPTWTVALADASLCYKNSKVEVKDSWLTHIYLLNLQYVKCDVALRDGARILDKRSPLPPAA